MGQADGSERTEAKASITEMVETVEREAADLEQRAAKLREAARLMREVASAPMQMVVGSTTTTVTATPLLAPTVQMVAPRTLPLPTKRIATSELILDVIAEQPGIKFDALVKQVVPFVTSEAKNKRKLVQSTVIYLKSKRRIFEFKDGGLYQALPKEEDNDG